MTRDEQDRSLILRGRKILLAEDNEFNIDIALTLLSALGAEIKVVTNGKQAVEAFLEKQPERYDFIFMDIEMPEMDGWMAVRKIRALESLDSRMVPIFAVTCNTSPSDIRRCMEVGFNEHIAKPLSTEILIKKLEKYL